MLTIAWTIAALIAATDAGTITGQVLDANGSSVPAARVFLEEGVAGNLREGIVDDEGRFFFGEVRPGTVGVFAVAEGHGFGGKTVTLGAEDTVHGLRIPLVKASSVSGKVVDTRGDPVQGARVTRLLLLGQYSVGIPLGKLSTFGITPPATDEKGRFSVSAVPAGCELALKFGHGGFAQEAATGITAGDTKVEVMMYPGVLVEGEVLTRDESKAVSQAMVVIKNGQPPHDTALVRTDGRGHFQVRLKPGVYFYHSEAAGLRSPGGQKLVVQGGRPQPWSRLLVAGLGEIRGEVRDAVSGEPVEDARLTLHHGGNLSAITRTGPTGAFAFQAVAGQNEVRLINAAGFRPPAMPSYAVDVAEGRTVELATLFLAPIPALKLRVLDEDGSTPVAGAVVSLLRPQQVGWQVADDAGVVTLAVNRLPQDGRIVGQAMHPRAERGGLFAFDTAATAEASVQLFPYASVEGRVMAGKRKGVAGVRVAGVTTDAGEDGGLVLWQTVSDSDGRFSWPAVLAGVPQRCMLVGAGENVANGVPFNMAPGENRVITGLTMPREAEGKSLLGQTLPWPGTSGGEAAVVVFCDAPEAEAMAAALRQVAATPGLSNVKQGLVVHGASPAVDGVTVHAGASPGEATVYTLDRSGKVRFETFHMPPPHLLQALE